MLAATTAAQPVQRTETWAVKYRGPLTGRTLAVRLHQPRVEMIGDGRLWVVGTDASSQTRCALPMADLLDVATA